MSDCRQGADPHSVFDREYCLFMALISYKKGYVSEVPFVWNILESRKEKKRN